MAYQAVFQRYELKFMLTLEQKALVLAAMEPYMALDEYGRTTIRNIYFDTDHYRLIRHSIDKPAYKEKLRIRSYAQVKADSPVFVELKKKYNSVVYKRRISLPEQQALDWLSGRAPCPKPCQISSEIDYFMQHYETLRPVSFLTYEREAYYCRTDDSFRVTFDDNILCRQSDLSLELGIWGDSLLAEDKVLMEIKCGGGIPLWMAKVLSQQRIYKTSFSKYGTAYQTIIFPKLKEANHNA